MVQVSPGKDSQGVLPVSFSLLGATVCMVVTIMGIKFRWFKRRLDFQQSSLPGDTRPRAQPLLCFRSQSSDDILPQGVFRKRNEEDGFTEFQKSKTLPPIKMRIPIRGSQEKAASPPPVPTIPQPDFSPMQTHFYTEDSQSTGEPAIKPRTFQKRSASGPRSPQKFGPRMNSNEDTQERRQTGQFFPDMDNSYIKDYSEGLGMSQRNSSKQAPDLLTSIGEKSTNSHSTTEMQPKEKVSMQIGGFSDNEHEEEDLFENIRIPKPEPRSGLPQVQAKRKIGTAEQKFGTEV